MPGAEQVEGGAFDGWSRWPAAGSPSFHEAIGPFQWKRSAENIAVARVETDARHSNGLGALHGGFISSCLDMALFAAAEPVLHGPAATTQLAVDYVGKGTPGRPLDIEAEVVSDVGRRVLVRVLIRQGATLIAVGSGALSRL